jgi:hypothetical protein
MSNSRVRRVLDRGTRTILAPAQGPRLTSARCPAEHAGATLDKQHADYGRVRTTLPTCITPFSLVHHSSQHSRLARKECVLENFRQNAVGYLAL